MRPPKAITDEMSSVVSVGVPGTVRGWETALRRYGTWSLGRTLRPAIRAAERGFVIDRTFYDQTDGNRTIFADFPATAELYLDRDGTPHDIGRVQRNPDLAETYRRLARDGADWFYRGSLAGSIVRTVTSPPVRPGAARTPRPGVMTTGDLAAYKAVGRRPTSIGYRGLDVYGMGPPSSGGTTVAEALNILERLAPQGLGALSREQALHLYLEATRLAYADRNAFVGDPSWAKVPGENTSGGSCAVTSHSHGA